jgi:hypothetical protein
LTSRTLTSLKGIMAPNRNGCILLLC